MASAPPPTPKSPSTRGKRPSGRPVLPRPPGETALQGITRILGRLTAATDLQETLQAALDAVRDALGADVGAIRLLQEPTGEMALAAAVGSSEAESADLEARTALHGGEISVRVARARTPLCIGSPEELAQLAPQARRSLGLASALCVPLLVQDRLVGTLLVGARRENAFGPKDLRRAQTIAQVVAPALDRAALYGEVERLYAATLRAKVRADALAEIGRALTSSFHLDDLLHIIVDKALTATHSEACVLYRWDAGRQVFLPAAVRGPLERTRREFVLAHDEGLSGLVLREGRPAWSTDVLADPRLRYKPAARERILADGYLSVLAVPISLQAEFFGTLMTYRRPPHTFDEEEVQFQAAVADRAAIAIGNARLFHAEQARRRQVEAVRAVSDDITRELDLTKLLALIIQRATELAGASAGSIYLWDEAAEVLVCAASYGLGAWSEDLRYRLGDGLTGTVAQQQRGMLINDYRSWERANPLFLARSPVTAALAEPLLYRNQLVGVITLNNGDTGRRFREEDRETLALFAAQAAIAIQNARLFDAQRRAAARAERQRAQAEALAAVGQAISSSLDLDHLLSLVVQRAATATGADAASIQERDPASGGLRFRRAYGLSSRHPEDLILPPGVGVAGEALATGRPQWTADAMTDPQAALSEDLRAHNAADGFRGVLSVPIRGGEGPYGVLSLCWRKPHEFDEEETAFATRIADQAAIAIENARLYQRALRTAEEIAALYKAGQAVTESLDLQATLGQIAESARHLAGADRAFVWLVDPQDGTLEAGIAMGPGAETFLGTRLPANSPAAAARAAREGRPFAVSNALDPASADPALSARFGNAALLAIPLRVQAAIPGVLVCGYNRPRAFAGAEVDQLMGLAQQAAIAIQNARLFQQEQERRLQVEAVRAVSEEITRELDLTTVIGLITRRATDLLRASAGTVWLWDEADQVLAPRAWQGYEEWLRDERRRLGEGVAGTVALRREGLILNEFRAWPDAPRIILERSPVAAVVAEPLLYRECLVGVIIVDRREGEVPFTEEDRKLLALFATQAAVAIENARLYREAADRATRLSIVNEIGRAVVAALDLEEVFHAIVHQVRRAIPCIRASLALPEPDGRYYRHAATYPAEKPSAVGKGVTLALGDDAIGRAFQSRQVVLVADKRHSTDEAGLRLAAEGILSSVHVPILAGPKVLGVLNLGQDRPEAFTADDVALLESLAPHLAVALQNAAMFAEAERRRRVAESVNRVSQMVTGALDLGAVTKTIAGAVVDLLEASLVRVYTPDPRAGGLALSAAAGEAELVRHETSRTKGMMPLAQEAFETGTPQSAWPIAEDPRYRMQEWARRHGLQMFLALPLWAGGEKVGVFTIHRRAARSLTDEEKTILSTFADHAAIAIQNTRLYAEARKAYGDLRAAQDQLVQVEKLRALGEMAGGVAHDFNNILAAILGRAELLRLRSPDPHVREDLAVIERAALDGAETVRRILGFARVRPDDHYAPVDLPALIPQVLEVTRPRWKDEAQGRGAAIEATAQLEAVPAVRGNAAELREVLVNLVFNAVDAMPQGGRLTFGVRRVSRPARAGAAGPPRRETLADEAGEVQELVEVFVRDTGVGMSEEVRRRVFEPFFTTKGVKGTGLGLSVVYGIVSRHGGEVLLESQEGAGTTVTLQFPATTQAPSERGMLILPPPGRAGQIVVVDDEPVLADALAEILRLQRHQVCAFTDPRRALDHLARGPADLLFTDLGMPEMSGWDLARQARDLRPDLPIVLVTGWGQQLDPAQIRERRVNAVVAKPFRAEDILHAVAQLLPAAP